MALTIGEFTKDIGIVGLSAAILALMIIAARRFGMALFDWANRDKTRREALAQGREQRDREWKAWLERMEAAKKDNREFTEPPPSERQEETQVA